MNCRNRCCGCSGCFCCNRRGVTTKSSCDQILESIACMENSLSKILSSESEKLQKILQISNDPDEILAVNESINTTIINIMHLEQVLYNKLQITKSIYPDQGRRNLDEYADHSGQ